jgi:hypothetical protein
VFPACMHVPTIEPLEGRIAPANLAYALHFGGSREETIVDIGTDAAGSTYVSGKFEGTVDFDPGPGVTSRTAPAGRELGFVAKYTNSGAFVFVDVIAPTNEDASELHLAVTPSGNVFVSGDFGHTTGTRLDFIGPSGDAASATTLQKIGDQSDLFVARLGSNGELVWAKSFGTTNPVAMSESDIALDRSGNVYVTGTLLSPVASSIAFNGATLNTQAGYQHLYVLEIAGDAPTVLWANSTTSGGATPSQIGHVYLAVDSNGQAGFSNSSISPPHR